jgi:hypothetical protein
MCARTIIREKLARAARCATVALAGLLFGGHALAIEEPEYTVVDVTNAYEIRRYAPYLVAEVDVAAASEKSAGGQAFRILAGYIFGDNQPQTKMAMTAPVEMTESNGGQKMQMTAPVESYGSNGTYTYAFVMERKYSLDTLPQPNDSRIRIREKPERLVAALRYSGRWSEDNYERHRTELAAALAADGIDAIGPYTLARYNSPFALPWFRRNEVLVEVRPDGD